jgi:uncharacterized protein involved in outer membrane biogenesis
MTIDGFRIDDPDGKALLDWRRLYVNAQLWPLLRGRLSFKMVDLEQPHLRIAIEKGGRLNFSDILDRLGHTSSTTAPQGKPMEVDIGRFRVGDAEVAFHDRSLAEPFATTIGPITIDLDHFRTVHDARSPYSFSGRTEAGETFAWSGTMGTDPLRSTGTFELKDLRLPKYAPYYEPQVAFQLQQGFASAKAAYEFEWSAARHVIKLHDGSVLLSQLACLEKNATAPAIQLDNVQASGLEADILDSTVTVASLQLKDGDIHARRDKDGRINLQTMLTPPSQPPSAKPTHFKLQVQELNVSNYGIQFEDFVPARPVQIKVDRIEASLKDFNLDPTHASPLEVSLRIGERASIQAMGTVVPFQSSGDLTLKLIDLDLPPLDAYLDTFADIRLNRGKLGLDGRLHFAFPGKKDDGLGYKGNLQISDLEARVAILNEPFLRWKQLRLLGSEVHSQRPSVAFKSIEWTDPEARLVMAPNGVSNVARALRIAPAGPVASAVPPSPQGGVQPLVRIARMHITGGRLSFIDRSIEPNAALLLSDMKGLYTGLSTESEEATMADFSGKAGGFAPITIQGKAMPLRHDKDTDVTIKIVGADLTDFSPYTGKYLGYTTREGKLDVDARVRIQDRKLNIEDKVRLDRMYLGDKVDSPDATHLPVKLGLAILRDRKGVIELEVPITGSLDDPDIHYGKMVWKAVLNVLGKIITSPFALLSNLFGGNGEDLSSVAFPAAAATLPPVEQKKLETLIKALVERPELKLEMEGATDAADALVYKRRGLEAQLRKLKWNARKVKIPASPEEEVIEPSEREKWLRAAFTAAFPTPAGASTEPPPLAEVEQRLLDAVKVDPNALRQLAEARVKAVMDGLLQGGQVDSSRIFEVQGGEAAKAGGSKVFFSLK